MTPRCAHPILLAAGESGWCVARCPRHSASGAGGDVWVWGANPCGGRCPCEAGNRFFVASERADTWWAERAEVVFGAPRYTVPGALRAAARFRFAARPGCALVTVPVRLHGTVFRTATHEAVLAVPGAACTLCVYPWLAAGNGLHDLPGARAVMSQGGRRAAGR